MNDHQTLPEQESNKQQTDSSTPLSTKIGVKRFSSRKIEVSKLSKQNWIAYIGFSLLILYSLVRAVLHLFK